MTTFRATFSSNFKDQKFVEQVISEWNSGASFFSMTSSGSTGKPKTVKLSRAMLLWSAEGTRQVLGLHQNLDQCNVLCCLPVKKTGGFMQLIRALCFGWQIHFVQPTMHPKLPVWDVGSKICIASFTPAQLHSLLSKDKIHLLGYHSILVGGAPIGLALKEELNSFLKETDTNVWETYGMTETASHIALKNVLKDPYFKPQTGVQLSLYDSQLCITIPELNFFIKTNDIAILHAKGFEVLGRVDDVINSGGVKIHPVLVEQVLEKVLIREGLTRQFYIGKKYNSKWGESVVLVIEGPPLDNIENLLTICKQALPAYHNPKEILFVASLERTDTGKMIRKIMSF